MAWDRFGNSQQPGAELLVENYVPRKSNFEVQIPLVMMGLVKYHRLSAGTSEGLYLGIRKE